MKRKEKCRSCGLMITRDGHHLERHQMMCGAKIIITNSSQVPHWNEDRKGLVLDAVRFGYTGWILAKKLNVLYLVHLNDCEIEHTDGKFSEEFHSAVLEATKSKRKQSFKDLLISNLTME